MKRRIEAIDPATGTSVGSYDTTKKAERETGINRTSISKVLNGHRPTAGGYTWRYYWDVHAGDLRSDRLEAITTTDAARPLRIDLASTPDNMDVSLWKEFMEWKSKNVKVQGAPEPYLGGNPDNVLIIGDTHEPFCREGYLEHCRKVQEQFDCGTVIHIGDEVDNHAISFHTSDPDGMSAGKEAQLALEKMKRWYHTFPEVKVIVGNHSALPFRQAVSNGLSRRFVKAFEEVWEAPKGWTWAMEHVVGNTMYIHGTGSSGAKAAINRAVNWRMNVVQGHLHTEASIQWSASQKDKVFGMQVGCGVDQTAYAMEYAKNYTRKFIMSCGVVLSGNLPIVVPMDL